MKIAVPTNNPGGLDAARSDHFGHCDLFTLIDCIPESKEVVAVATLENGGHEAGGCMAPVSLLHQAGVEAIVVGGLGARPMRGFADVGIAVYFAAGGNGRTVAEVVDDFLARRLPLMHPEQVCKGSGNCHH